MRFAPQFLAVLVLSVPNSPVQAQSTRQERVDVGGYYLQFVIAEPARATPRMPTIVLESGAGEDSSAWTGLQADLAREFATTVVAYDRAGFGESDLPDARYDIHREVSDLRVALSKLGLERSVLLVGHSWGGLLVQLYASAWPQSVAGAVFLDPSTPGAWVALSDYFEQLTLNPDPQTSAERALSRLVASVADSYFAAYRSPLPTTLPIVVVSAEHGPLPQLRQNDAFVLTHQLLAKSVDRGEWILANRATHDIARTRPDIVVESIRRVLSFRP